MIQVLAYCEKCNSNIKIIEGKNICNCGKKIVKIEIKEGESSYTCLICGKEYFAVMDKRRKRHYCDKCGKTRHNANILRLYHQNKNRKKKGKNIKKGAAYKH